MARRTQKQIENDYKMIKEISKKATSMKELSDMTGLSYAQIKVCLAEHPIVERRIKGKLRNNATSSNSKKEDTHSNVKKESITQYVIDASVVGKENIKNTLGKILTIENSKIVLTSITIKELKNIEEYPQMHKVPKNLDSKDATYIFNLAIENIDKFESVAIDESVGTPDDCIIKYCADHKENLVLLTGDKEMCLKARMYGIQSEYFKKEQSAEEVKPNGYRKINTLWDADIIGANLYINTYKNKNKSICVYSDGIKHEEKMCKLNIGDDIYIAVQKDTYIVFAHYRLLLLSSKDNCELIYSRRICNSNEISRLPNSFYKNFIKDFYAMINL